MNINPAIKMSIAAMPDLIRHPVFAWIQAFAGMTSDGVFNCRSNNIWIDLENSPHVLFFNPIIKELKHRGYNVVVTARNYAQVYDLAKLFNIEHKAIGRHFGKSKALKIPGLLSRSFQLLIFVVHEKPDLAFNHGSRSQFLTAKLMNIS